MAQLSFKNVGVLADVRKKVNEQPTLSETPIGILTPLRTAPGTFFEMSYRIDEQVADNLRNLILTNFGDRLGMPQLCTNLLPLVAEFDRVDDFDAEAMARIKTSVTTWMPYIELTGYESFPEFRNGIFQRSVRIVIAYSAPKLNIKNSLLEVDIKVM